MTNYRKVVQDHSDNIHEIIRQKIIEKCSKITTRLEQVHNNEMVQDHPIILYDLAPIPDSINNLKKRRFCIVTGINISDQKEGSRFVRKTTLRAMKLDIYPLMYDYLKSKFGPERKQPKDFEEELEIIAKKIRNKISNHTATALQQPKESL